MRRFRLLILFSPLLFLLSCHSEREAETPAPYGVETAFPFEGSVDNQPFLFFLREANAWQMVGHAGYFNAWETNYEFNSATTADGDFYFRLEYPMDRSPYQVFQPGPLTRGLESFYWQLRLSVPGDEGLASYRAAHRRSREDVVVTRSQRVSAPAHILDRSPILLDHQGQPYFEVQIRFETPVVRTDLPEEPAFLLTGEGTFRVPVLWEQMEK